MEIELSGFKLRELNKDDFDRRKTLWSLYIAFYHTSLNELIYETTFARLVSKDNKAQSGIVLCKTMKWLG